MIRGVTWRLTATVMQTEQTFNMRKSITTHSNTFLVLIILIYITFELGQEVNRTYRSTTTSTTAVLPPCSSASSAWAWRYLLLWHAITVSASNAPTLKMTAGEVFRVFSLQGARWSPCYFLIRRSLLTSSWWCADTNDVNQRIYAINASITLTRRPSDSWLNLTSNLEVKKRKSPI